MTRRPWLAGVLVAALAAVAVAGVSQYERPPVVDAAPTEQKVAVSISTNCAATDENEVWCWGEAWDGQLGNGSIGISSYDDVHANTPVQAATTGTEVSGGCARTTGGAITCWGGAGTIEDGTGSLFSTPPWGSTTPQPLGFGTATKISGRCALLAAGTVQCQGWHNWGQLGNGASSWPQSGYPIPPNSSSSAVTVSGLANIIDISNDGGTNCALRNDGTVWCWGFGGFGELGNGQSGTRMYGINTDSYHSTVPVQVGGITDAVAIGGTCAIRTGGAVSCWGGNRGRRISLAADTSTNFATPVPMPQFQGATSISTSPYMICATLQDGTAWCQGWRALGNGTETGFSTGGLGQATGITAGYQIRTTVSHTCVLETTGEISCWGSQFRGRLGNGVSGADSNSLALTPSKVIGFGGALPEDEIEMTMTVDPAELDLELDGDGDPVPREIVVTVTVENISDETVDFVRVDEMLSTTLIAGDEKLITQTAGPTTAEAELGTFPPDHTRDVMYTFEVSGDGVFGIEGLTYWADPTTSQTETAFAETQVEVGVADGFEVALAEQPTGSFDVVEIEATIQNLTGEEITGITWENGELTVEDLQGTDIMRLASGPSEALPTTLADGEVKRIRWRFDVAFPGAVVFVLEAEGRTSPGDKVVAGLAELSAEVSATELFAADVQDQATLALESHLRQMKLAIDDLAIEPGATVIASEAQQYLAEHKEQYKRLGFSDWSAEFMAANDLAKDTFESYWESFKTGSANTAGERYDEFVASMTSMYDVLSDPVKRNVLASELVDAGVTNFGYLGEALNTPTPEALVVAWESWGDASVVVREDIGFAASGQVEIWREGFASFVNDPVGTAGHVGERHGGQATDVGLIVTAGVAEEIATGGAATVVRIGRETFGEVIGQGLRRMRNTTSAVDAGEDVVDAGVDSVGSASRRLAEGEASVSRFQDLEYGQVLTRAELERLGGFNATDAARVQQISQEASDIAGVPVQLVARTAEPYSVGIDGVGKRAFTKQKAVGEMDRVLGAPQSLEGRVSVFRPDELSPDSIAFAELDNPGFTERYLARLATQQKNWDAWQAGMQHPQFTDNWYGSATRMQKLVAGSERHGGITVLDATPGRPLPPGLDYYEQLAEPEWRALNGVSESDALQLQLDLIDHPSRTPANLRAFEQDGAITFTDAITENGTPKPIISDYDFQAVIGDGVDIPPGVRGQVETYVKQQLDMIGRHGRHGWSNAAQDLPAEYFNVAAEYILETTHPAAGRQVAEDLVKRFGELADDFARQAERAPVGSAQRERLERTAAKFRDLATRQEGNLDAADLLLRDHPPGEKTIVFTPGRIAVGSNQGSP